MRQKAPIVFLVTLSLILGTGTILPAAAPLNHYLKKYREIQASRDQLKRLARYDNLIRYFCSIAYIRPRHKVNEDFLRALILAESDARPRALSDKGARGLTQITWPTGKRAAQELLAGKRSFRFVSRKRLENLQADDLYDPAVNILLACYLVAKYNYQFNGKLDLVVSAWNAGENSINNNRPAQYPETLNHIGKVNGYFIYFLRQKKQKRGRKRVYAYRRP